MLINVLSHGIHVLRSVNALFTANVNM